jgi:hypothetical protein
MQNDSSKLILSSLANEFLNASYIQLAIFLFISFKYYYFFNLFFYKYCIFPKYLIFQLLRKKEMWKRDDKVFLQTRLKEIP